LVEVETQIVLVVVHQVQQILAMVEWAAVGQIRLLVGRAVWVLRT
jgi:hypothetical protein